MSRIYPENMNKRLTSSPPLIRCICWRMWSTSFNVASWVKLHARRSVQPEGLFSPNATILGGMANLKTSTKPRPLCVGCNEKHGTSK